MAGWHHRLDGHEFEWTPGVGDWQGGLACCDSWGLKESDTTERLNWTELIIIKAIIDLRNVYLCKYPLLSLYDTELGEIFFWFNIVISHVFPKMKNSGRMYLRFKHTEFSFFKVYSFFQVWNQWRDRLRGQTKKKKKCHVHFSHE